MLHLLFQITLTPVSTNVRTRILTMPQVPTQRKSFYVSAKLSFLSNVKVKLHMSYIGNNKIKKLTQRMEAYGITTLLIKLTVRFTSCFKNKPLKKSYGIYFLFYPPTKYCLIGFSKQDRTGSVY